MSTPNPEQRALWRSDAEHFSGQGAHARILVLLDSLESAEAAPVEARLAALVGELTALGVSWVGFDESHHFGDAVLKALAKHTGEGS